MSNASLQYNVQGTATLYCNVVISDSTDVQPLLCIVSRSSTATLRTIIMIMIMIMNGTATLQRCHLASCTISLKGTTNIVYVKNFACEIFCQLIECRYIPENRAEWSVQQVVTDQPLTEYTYDITTQTVYTCV